MVPSFSTFNAVGGMFVSGLVILIAYYQKVWNSSHLPINSNRIYDHYGNLYNVSLTIDERGMYNDEQYTNYSAPYMAISNALLYGFFFAMYSAVITHVALYHRHEVVLGAKSLYKSVRRSLPFLKTNSDTGGEQLENEGEYQDVHNRLMAVYPEGAFYLGMQNCELPFPLHSL